MVVFLLLLLVNLSWSFLGDWKNRANVGIIHDGLEWNGDFYGAAEGGVIKVSTSGEVTLYQSNKGLNGLATSFLALHENSLWAIQDNGAVLQLEADQFKEKNQSFENFAKGLQRGKSFAIGNYWVLLFQEAITFFSFSQARAELSISKIGNIDFSTFSPQRIGFVEGKLLLEVNDRSFTIAFDTLSLTNSKQNGAKVNHSDPSAWVELSSPDEYWSKTVTKNTSALFDSTYQLVSGTSLWAYKEESLWLSEPNNSIALPKQGITKVHTISSLTEGGVLFWGEKGIFTLNGDNWKAIWRGDASWVTNDFPKYRVKALQGNSLTDFFAGTWGFFPLVQTDERLDSLKASNYCYSAFKDEFQIVPAVEKQGDDYWFIYWKNEATQPGIAHWEDGKVECFSNDSLPTWARALSVDQNGFWIGGSNKLQRWQKGEAFSFSLEKSVPLGEMRDIVDVLIDDKNTLWVNGLSGLAVRCVAGQPEHFCKFTSGDTLVRINESLGVGAASGVSMLLDPNQTLWWATQRDGLFSVDVETFSYKKYTPRDGMLSYTISDIAMDQEGWLWLAQENGVSALQTRGATTASSVSRSKIRPFPNPFYRNTHSTLRFEGLSEESQVYLFTESGHLVKHFDEKQTTGGFLEWNIPSSWRYGIYYWVAKSVTKVRKGKWILAP